MGLFDFFRKPAPPSVSPQIPTIPVPKELNQTYRRVFMAEFETIEAFTSDEVLRMLQLIEGGDGGHLNQSHYHKAVYEQLFRAREWRWPWYEHWDAKFKEFGAYPPDWPDCDLPDAEPSSSKIVSLLNVQELKQGLIAAGVKFPSASNKKALQELATSNDEVTALIASSEVGGACAEKYALTQGYSLYVVLMRTLSFWAKDEFEAARRAALGITQTKLITIGPEFESFVKLALTENSQARCPLYPGDRTLRVARGG